jgi:holo-[acyl-carrier protein] synthase
VIIGSGIDFIDSSRLIRELAREPWAPEHGIFTSSEIEFCNVSKKSALLYAACFAAKEAALKALGIEAGTLACFREVEVLPDAKGNCAMRLYGQAQAISKQLGVHRVSVAVTMSKRLSGAAVVLES